MSEIGQENQQFELGVPAMFEIQILFHLFSNVRHRLIKIYKKGSHDKRFCIKTWHKKESWLSNQS